MIFKIKVSRPCEDRAKDELSMSLNVSATDFPSLIEVSDQEKASSIQIRFYYSGAEENQISKGDENVNVFIGETSGRLFRVELQCSSDDKERMNIDWTPLLEFLKSEIKGVTDQRKARNLNMGRGFIKLISDIRVLEKKNESKSDEQEEVLED